MTSIEGTALAPNECGTQLLLHCSNEAPTEKEKKVDEEATDFAFVNVHYTSDNTHVFLEGGNGSGCFVPQGGPPPGPVNIYQKIGQCHACQLTGKCSHCTDPNATYQSLDDEEIEVCKCTGVVGEQCTGGCYVCATYTQMWSVPTVCEQCGLASMGNRGGDVLLVPTLMWSLA